MKLMPSTEQMDHFAKMHSSTTGESYVESLRFVERFFATGGERIDLAGADAASLLHEEILALIEKERLAGRKLTFLQAAQRIERERQAAKG